jgi:hypothetical protein
MMDCRRAIDLLSGYAVGALSNEQRERVQQHLGRRNAGDGCPSCQQELDELRAAADLLAESVTPVVPRPELKQALLERIACEPHRSSIGAPSRPDESLVAQQSWQKYLPYIAATFCAVTVGTWATRSADRPSNNGAQTHLGDRARVDQWRRQIAAAKQAFGAPRMQVAKLEAEVAGQGLGAAIFSDGLAGEVHVLVSNVEPPSEGQQLWLWLFDSQGARLTQGRLEYFGQGHAAGIFDVPAAPRAIPAIVSKLIITDEPPGNPAEPAGRVVGDARLPKS